MSSDAQPRLTAGVPFDPSLRARALALLAELDADAPRVPADERELAERLCVCLQSKPAAEHRRLRREALRVLIERHCDTTATRLERARRAQLLTDYGVELSHAEHAEQDAQTRAFEVALEASSLYRALSKEEPTRFLPELALALMNLGASHGELGQGQPAIESTREAIEIYRKLAPEATDATGPAPELACALDNLSVQLANCEQFEAALEPSREAVARYQGHYGARPGQFGLQLAGALDNLGRCLILLEREAELLDVMNEQVTLLRTLGAEPSLAPRALPELARLSTKLARRRSHVGEHDSAVAHGLEAVTALRTLAAAQPETFTASLAAALSEVSVDLSQVQRHDEALACSREAVEGLRPLADQDPERFGAPLAQTLDNLAKDLVNAGHPEQGLVASGESIDLLRTLVSRDPENHQLGLLTALGDFALDLAEYGQVPRAGECADEAVALARSLAAVDPESYEPELAQVLDVRGVIQSKLGQHQAAWQSLCEGLEVLAPHYRLDPDEHEELLEELRLDLQAVCERSGLVLPGD